MAILVSAILFSGCAGQNRIEVQSVREAIADTPTLPTAVYGTADGNTADIYLTDLPASALDPGASLTGVSGRLAHLHLFVAPKAGSTPIAASACSVTIRYIVIAEGNVGVYAGGGFLLPRSSVGDESFQARVDDATLRLTGRTEGFHDRLGPSTMNAQVAAQRDESGARRLAARVDDLVRAVPKAE
jgi:hypothetical protein